MDFPSASGRMNRIKGWNRMMAASKVFLSAALVLIAGVAVAQDRGLPTIDLQKRCRSSAASTMETLGDKTAEKKAFDSCMKSEQEARDALLAAWKDIPPRYKSQCIKPGVFSPSYVEWIACLELELDVKRLRSKN